MQTPDQDGADPVRLLGRRVEEARLRRGWTYQELEDRTGIPHSTLQYLVRRRQRVPELYLLKGIVETLGEDWREWEDDWRRAARATAETPPSHPSGSAGASEPVGVHSPAAATPAVGSPPAGIAGSSGVTEVGGPAGAVRATGGAEQVRATGPAAGRRRGVLVGGAVAAVAALPTVAGVLRASGTRPDPAGVPATAPTSGAGICLAVTARDVRVFSSPVGVGTWTVWPEGSRFWADSVTGDGGRYRTPLRNGRHGWVTSNRRYVTGSGGCP